MEEKLIFYSATNAYRIDRRELALWIEEFDKVKVEISPDLDGTLVFTGLTFKDPTE